MISKQTAGIDCKTLLFCAVSGSAKVQCREALVFRETTVEAAIVETAAGQTVGSNSDWSNSDWSDSFRRDFLAFAGSLLKEEAAIHPWVPIPPDAGSLILNAF